MSLINIMILAFVIILFAVCVFIVIGILIEKYKSISNPIRKDNSDYRFIEVDNIKTRNIFNQK